MKNMQLTFFLASICSSTYSFVIILVVLEVDKIKNFLLVHLHID